MNNCHGEITYCFRSGYILRYIYCMVPRQVLKHAPMQPTNSHPDNNYYESLTHIQFLCRESTVPLAWLVPLRMVQLPRWDVGMENQVDCGSINLWLYVTLHSCHLYTKQITFSWLLMCLHGANLDQVDLGGTAFGIAHLHMHNILYLINIRIPRPW